MLWILWKDLSAHWERRETSHTMSLNGSWKARWYDTGRSFISPGNLRPLSISLRQSGGKKLCSSAGNDEGTPHTWCWNPHALSTFLVTCCSSCCCLLCFLAGRGGGVSFKGKGSTGVAMTSGQAADEGWVTGWRERVEGNRNPEQTAALCFRGERRGTHRPVWDGRTEETEARNL